MSLIKKYMPEKDKEPVKERAKGRDVMFAQKAYPSLLISKINISGTTSKDKQGKAIAFAGSYKKCFFISGYGCRTCYFGYKRQ
jgi:hypothetical protein